MSMAIQVYSKLYLHKVGNLHFYTAKDLDQLAGSEENFMDTTYPMVQASDFAGLFIIWDRVSYRGNHKGTPLAFVLLQEESKQSFNAIFEKIFLHMAERGLTWNSPILYIHPVTSHYISVKFTM